MSLDKEKIKHVAKLARISVDEAKVESLTKDLNSIFKFIEQLNELNTDKVEPLTSIHNQSLRSRKDEISDGKIREKILKNSPKENEEFFKKQSVVVGPTTRFKNSKILSKFIVQKRDNILLIL